MLRPGCWEVLPSSGLSLVSVFCLLVNLRFSYFASTRVADSLEWYSCMLTSS